MRERPRQHRSHPLLCSFQILGLAAVASSAQARQSEMVDDGMMMSGGMAGAESEFSREQLDFFESRIRPLLISACSGCHSDNGSRIRAGFEIDTRDAMIRGGDSGAGIVPGDPDASLLIQAVRYDDPFLQMPPRGPPSSSDADWDLEACAQRTTDNVALTLPSYDAIPQLPLV